MKNFVSIATTSFGTFGWDNCVKFNPYDFKLYDY